MSAAGSSALPSGDWGGICGIIYALACAVSALPMPVSAQTDAKAPITQPATGAGDTSSAAAGADDAWSKFKLGAGLSFTVDIGDLDRVSDAVIVDNVVRVTDQNNGRARVMLEGHYFWKIADQIGVGPFVAIQPGSSEIIDAFGMGLMVGFKRGKTNDSFNIGVGLVFDPNTRVLGDGFVANQAPPGNETEVRYRETLQTGVFVVTSFSF